jgi:hypothetical protein
MRNQNPGLLGADPDAQHPIIFRIWQSICMTAFSYPRANPFVVEKLAHEEKKREARRPSMSVQTPEIV